MEIVNGKMVVTEPQEFDLAKVQISRLEDHQEKLQETIQLLTRKIIAHSQEFDRSKTQIDILDDRYQQVVSGVQMLIQKQTTSDNNSQKWLQVQSETKALRTKNEQLSHQLTKQRHQTIWATAITLVLVTIGVWTEIRLAKLNSILLITQQTAQS
jgi:predicted RNase H-like nuclease (RuvC/YqgF family)